MAKAVFGGSFDPVHKGHVEIVKKALTSQIDEIIIMPNYLNPLKNTFCAPPDLRIRWLKEVFKKFKNVSISDFELSQKRPVYTIETVKFYKPDFFIIGSDNLKNLHKWHKIEDLLQMVEFVVASRGEFDKTLLSKYNIKKVLNTDIEVSSTDIRNCRFKFIPKEIEKEVKEFYGKNCKN